MNQITRLLAILVLAFAPLSLFADQDARENTWGEKTGYHQYERFYISGQPDLAALDDSRKTGVSIVINLRGETESDWDESGAAASLGLEYHQVPVNSKGPELSPEPFSQITAIVDANPDAQILVHCASGNRAAAWLAVYLAETRGLDAEYAIEAASANGLTSKGLESKVRALITD